ncbi:MAG TPA: isochorismatase family protein [Actinomycetota bacterium]
MTTYDPETALVVADVQNDFADPAGSLYVAGGDRIVGAINEEIDRAEHGGALVVYTQDWHPASTPHFKESGGVWPVHCVRETWGAAFHPALRVAGPVVRKGTGGEDGYSGFSVRDPVTGEQGATALGAMLAERGIRRVAVVGLATDYCVKATALDAAEIGYETTVRRDLARAVNLNDGDERAAIEEMRAAGVTVEQPA